MFDDLQDTGRINYEEELRRLVNYIDSQLEELDRRTQYKKTPATYYLAKYNFANTKAMILKYLNDIVLKKEMKDSLEKKLENLNLDKIETFADLILLLKDNKK